MKKLLGLLLTVTLLLSLAVTASAETYTDDENLDTTVAATEEVEDTDSDDTSEPESGSSSQIKIVPSASDLPEGYEIDPDFSVTITLNDENGWSYNLKDLLAEAGADEYIYFVVEKDVAEGYADFYAVNDINRARNSSDSEGSGGKVIVVRNVLKGEPPVYELPESGGIGVTSYLAAGTAILTIAAVYCMILYCKRRRSE
ncbi:MAG: hypothetical protein J1F23_05025 [Oscillospiraceae bacterium]|nr:hypothetical protein [Oscillospiraceae bacterium]